MYKSSSSSHPSLRWRRRRSSSSAAVPRRCSSVVSVASSEGDSSPPSSFDEDGADAEDDGAFDEGRSFRDILRFDSLDLRSTSWRRRRMLASIERDGELTSKVSRVTHFGVEACIVPRRFHYAASELEPYRAVGDPEMDALLQYLSLNKDANCGCGAFDDVVSHAKNEHGKGGGGGKCDPSPPVRFYEHYREGVPSWVDFDEIQRGIDVFLAYLPAAGCSLFYRSLVGGFSIPRIAEVLRATRYLVPTTRTTAATTTTPGDDSKAVADRDRRRSVERLADTGGFLACCFAPPAHPPSADAADDDASPPPPPAAASLRPGGEGWEAALRVRVLHAKVRRSLLVESTPRWDVAKNGVPINQEDMAATLLAFSVNVLLGIEIAAGRPLPEHEQRDYLALWRYLGWLLGVDTVEVEGAAGEVVGSSNGDDRNRLMPIDPCGPRKTNESDGEGRPRDGGGFGRMRDDASDDSIIHSYAALESMILHLLHPEQSSRDLVSHLSNLRPYPLFRSEVCRRFLGDPLSDELGIPEASASWRGRNGESVRNIANHLAVKFFVQLFLLFLRWYTLLTMTFPRVQRRVIAWHASLETRYLRGWKEANARRTTKAAAGVEQGGSSPPESPCYRRRIVPSP